MRRPHDLCLQIGSLLFELIGIAREGLDGALIDKGSTQLRDMLRLGSPGAGFVQENNVLSRH